MRPPVLVVVLTSAAAVLVVLGGSFGGGEPGGETASPPTTPSPTTIATQSHPEEHAQSHDEIPHGEHGDEAVPPSSVPPGVEKLSRSPLVQALPHSTTRYRIDGHIRDGELVLTITLHAVINQASQQARYRDQLRQYRAEALDFIRSRGSDPSLLQITFAPPEAASL